MGYYPNFLAASHSAGASLAEQQVVRASLGSIAVTARTAGVAAPATLVSGGVAAMGGAMVLSSS